MYQQKKILFFPKMPFYLFIFIAKKEKCTKRQQKGVAYVNKMYTNIITMNKLPFYQKQEVNSYQSNPKAHLWWSPMAINWNCKYESQLVQNNPNRQNPTKLYHRVWTRTTTTLNHAKTTVTCSWETPCILVAEMLTNYWPSDKNTEMSRNEY